MAELCRLIVDTYTDRPHQGERSSGSKTVVRGDFTARGKEMDSAMRAPQTETKRIRR